MATENLPTCNGDGHVAVVMVPLPAQGHLNQLLHLSRRIAAFNLRVHFVGAATHNRQAKLRVHGWNTHELANVHFHDLRIPSFPSPPPDPTAAIKFPSHLLPSFRAAALHLRDPLTEFLRSLSSKTRRIIVIHDSLMASAVQGIRPIPNAESYAFHSVSAFAIALHSLDREEIVSPTHDFKKDLKIPSLDGCFPKEFLDFIDSQFRLPNIDAGKIYNTSKVIERPYLEVLQTINDRVQHWALGPFNPVKIPKRENESSATRFCLEWLDRQQPKSVIYISFGTTTAMEDEQIREIAFGLERSEQKFIWVLRDADEGDVFNGRERKSELPEGFEKRVAERGLVVREWAPQLEILSHESTGGFMSHCGWNSCVESLTMGVPVAAWPMHSDQPRNTVLMTEVLRVGLVVKQWARRDEVVGSRTVENAVRRLMASEEGDKMRKRAEELGGAVRRSVEDCGVARREMSSFIAHITR